MTTSAFSSFLSEEELNKRNIEFTKLQLVLTETYNENELLKSIELIGNDTCCAIAIQLAIIGYGNKKYGSVVVNGIQIDIDGFFKNNGIKSELKIDVKLKPGDLTPRRLIRFYRFAIQKYISENKDVYSYLFKKYCLVKNENNRTYIFPGFEHIANPTVDGNKVIDLLSTYEYLDRKLGTKISERIIRVLVARGFNRETLFLSDIQ